MSAAEDGKKLLEDIIKTFETIALTTAALGLALHSLQDRVAKLEQDWGKPNGSSSSLHN